MNLASVTDACAARYTPDYSKICGNLHIEISNQTSSTCILSENKIIYGYQMATIPTTLLPKQSGKIDMIQVEFYAGPNVILSYQCGQETIRFSSQQNYCALKPGEIHGNVLEPIPNTINADFTIKEGTVYPEGQGVIEWIIVEKNSDKPST
jgi:hypothetical protein